MTRCGECGGPLGDHVCVDCGTRHGPAGDPSLRAAYEELTSHWNNLTEAVSLLLGSEGRFVVLADDLSLIVTTELDEGDFVIYDRAGPL